MALSVVATMAMGGAAQAQSRIDCGERYEIRRGDNLYDIARALYGDSTAWTRIFYTNRETLGSDPAKIFPGQVIVPPCEAEEDEADDLRAQIEARDAGRTPAADDPATPETPAPADTARRSDARDSGETDAGGTGDRSVLYRQPVSFLAADDFRPFTDRSLPAGGMITEIVASAMRTADIPHEIVWINDRSAHLDPILSRHMLDFGFPWSKPDCEEGSEDVRCTGFLYSDPVFEVLIKFFALRESRFRYETDDDIAGQRLCRPAGYDVSDLDANGRDWLRGGKVVLLRPNDVRTCFELLMDGKVDAVTMNEFTGLEVVAQLDIGDLVTPALKATSVQPLHIAIARDHPRASVLMFRLNGALADLRENGTYKETVSDHLALFWRDNG